MVEIPLEPFLKYPKIYQNLIRSTLQAGLDSVDPYTGVLREMGKSKNIHQWKMDNSQDIILIAFGKASFPMASAAITYLGDDIRAGIIITKIDNSQYKFDNRFTVLEGGHPEPNGNSVEAGELIRKLITESNSNTKVLCLISGGGSALVANPKDAVTLHDTIELNQTLLSHHLSIEGINTIRKSIDEFKGGGLARWIDEREADVYILSDIVSGELDQVASGPTYPVRHKSSKALKVVNENGLKDRIPKKIMDYLIHSATLEVGTETEKSNNRFTIISHRVIGDLTTASSAMARKAEEFNYPVTIHYPWLQCDLESGAELLGKAIINEIKKGKRAIHIWGGELTVEKSGSGTGGRNTHLELMLTTKLADLPGFIFISFATDGDDGNSKAAGVVIDGKTYTKIMQRHINLEYYLNNFDSGSLFKLTGDLINTGPTGTNVNDLFIAIIDPEIGHTGE